MVEVHQIGVPALYVPALLPEHAGNPLIEALPPFRQARELVSVFGRHPSVAESERQLPAALRMLAVSRINGFLEMLEEHAEVIDLIGLVVRAGYVWRNPDDAGYQKALVKFYRSSMAGDIKPIETGGPSTAPCFSLFGFSGVGKSSVIERALTFMPQVIVHRGHGFVQLVYMKIDCPPDGSLKQMLLGILDRIDRLIGTRYRMEFGKKSAIDDLIIYVGNKAAEHHLGILVIDEIQNLLDASGVSQKVMLNFFVEFGNVVKIPVVVVGTVKALGILQGTFQEARRVGDHGSIIWGPLKQGSDFRNFLEALWEYQWTEQPFVLTDAVEATMFELTLGIHALATRLYQLSQLRAIRDGVPLSEQLLRTVAAERFRLLAPMLDAMRRNDQAAMGRYEDLFTDAMDALGHAVDQEAVRAKARRVREELSAESFERARAMSTLLALGHPEAIVRSVTERLFDENPALKSGMAIHLFIQAIETDRTTGDLKSSPSLTQILAEAAERGTDPLAALAQAGLTDGLGGR